MTEKCPVCKNNIKINDRACSVCGFTDLHKEFITKEDGELWIKNVVEPYKKQYEEIKKAKNNKIYDADGYDEEGYNKFGYDRNGYNRKGWDKLGYNREGYDKRGIDKKGYYKNGVHAYNTTRSFANNVMSLNDNNNANGHDITVYDRDGYEKSGYLEKGYNDEFCKSAKIGKMIRWTLFIICVVSFVLGIIMCLNGMSSYNLTLQRVGAVMTLSGVLGMVIMAFIMNICGDAGFHW